MLRLCTLLAVGVAALFGTAPAGGGTISVSDTTLAYQAAAGESNHVTIKVMSNQMTLTWLVDETGANLTAGPGCVVVAHTATCSVDRSAGARLVLDIDLVDGDDWLSAAQGCFWDEEVDDDMNFVTCTQRIDGGAGEDTLIGADLAYFEGELVGGEGDDVLVGGDAGAFLLGGPGEDLLLTRESSVLDGGPGADTLIGEGEFDQVPYSDRVGTVRVSLNGRRDDGESGENDLVIGAEWILTGSGDDVVVADSSSNSISAGAGNDVVYAGGGPDHVTGDSGDSCSFGGGGPGGADRLYGQSGDDRLVGCGGNDVIYGGVGPDFFLSGTGGSDRLYGGDQVDNVYGGLGNDTIGGGRGQDDLRGQEGNDTFYARDRRADRIVGWTGTDRARIDRGLDRRSSIERLF
jgi:Ca2+-binding RTX toxin-like protein